jgi:hypothetical protein
MANPPGPDKGDEPAEPTATAADEQPPQAEPEDAPGADEQHNAPTEAITTPPEDTSPPDHEPATEAFAPQSAGSDDAATEVFASAPSQPAAAPESGERRFTAPSGFDAGNTQKIDSPHEPATEVFASNAAGSAPKAAAPQVIPPRGEQPKAPQTRKRSWGWVVAVVLVIAALAAIAILGTLLLTRGGDDAASQEDQVRATIENFDVAVQKGDLATLRTITCGSTRDSYVKYDDRTWAETHARVAAAKQYPVVASIDQVVVNGDHAEANVTTFMAFAPQTRSTRSFDLQFRDEQWKICQAPTP